MSEITRQKRIIGNPPRIAPMTPAEYIPEGLAVLASLREALSLPPSDEVPEFNATMFRNPGVMRGQAQLSVELFKGTLTPRESEMAIVRTAWLCQAPFLFGEHVQTAKRLGGMETADIDRIKTGPTAEGLDEHDRAILRAVDELHDDAMISDDTWAALATKWGEEKLLELPVLVGHYHGVAFLQNSVRLRLRPGNPGLSSR